MTIFSIKRIEILNTIAAFWGQCCEGFVYVLLRTKVLTLNYEPHSNVLEKLKFLFSIKRLNVVSFRHLWHTVNPYAW